MADGISPDDRKRIVVDFLQRCNAYADAKLRDYNTRMRADTGHVDSNSDELMQLADKISHWSAYRAFNDVAIHEIHDGELDDWFEE